jgi:hypothetical protein
LRLTAAGGTASGLNPAPLNGFVPIPCCTTTVWPAWWTIASACSRAVRNSGASVRSVSVCA